MRNVALFASNKSSQQFNKEWPLPAEEGEGFEQSSESYKEYYEKIRKKLKLK